MSIAKAHFSNQDPKELKIREALGNAFWSLASHYQLTLHEQAVLLGIKENRQRLKLLKDKRELPDDPDKLLRVSHLVGIHKSLRILFPHNREVVYKWLKTKREQFGDKSALEFIEEGPEMESLLRLASVRRFLDQVRVL